MGRDCIERNSIESFNCRLQCSVSCEGIYADVQWVGEHMNKEVKDDEMDLQLLNKTGKKIGEMKESNERKGEELDKKKFIEMISEYTKFKRNSVRHFRFNSSSIFGELGITSQMILISQEKNSAPLLSWCRSTLTRRPLTRSRGTGRSRRRPS